MKLPSEGDANVLNLVGMVAQFCECSKTYGIVHIKNVNYMVCGLNLKPMKKKR
jgi:hypothetical protein